MVRASPRDGAKKKHSTTVIFHKHHLLRRLSSLQCIENLLCLSLFPCFIHKKMLSWRVVLFYLFLLFDVDRRKVMTKIFIKIEVNGIQHALACIKVA